MGDQGADDQGPDDKGTIDTWYKDGDDKEWHEEHAPFWETLIDGMWENDLRGKCVLDYGCSRGSLLEVLAGIKPYRHGYGIDVSREAIEAARERGFSLPCSFYLGADTDEIDAAIDVAISYEVLFLLPSIEEHAQQMRRFLKTGGVYYAATGCLTTHPRWEDWKKVIAERSTLQTYNYSPNHIAEVFKAADFEVSVAPLGHRGHVPVLRYPDYFPTVQDSINYYRDQVLVFRFVKSELHV